MPVERPLSDEELGMAVMLKTSRFSWSFFVESVSAAAPLITPWGSRWWGHQGLLICWATLLVQVRTMAVLIKDANIRASNRNKVHNAFPTNLGVVDNSSFGWLGSST